MTDTIWTRTCLKWIVVCQCIVTVVLLVVLLSLVRIWSIKRHRALDQRENLVCIPCYKLLLSENDDLAGFEQTKESDVDYMTCCNVGSKVLDRLIEKHANSKYKDLRPTRLIGSLGDECTGKQMNPQTTYVKMTGINFTEMENDIDNIIRWNRTELQGEVNPIDGNIFIKNPGFYFVFSNLKLHNPESNSSMVHNHYVYLHSYIGETLYPLLENSNSCCQMTSVTSDTSSTIGGVFKLEKHDKLFVRSSHPQHLSSSEYSNMFGLYMI